MRSTAPAPRRRLRAALVAALPLLAGLGGSAAPTSAATPASATITVGQSVSWDFAPVGDMYLLPYFAPPGDGIEQICPPGVCDRFDLTVSLPSEPHAFYATHGATLHLVYSWQQPTPATPEDMDMFVIDPRGNELGPGHPDSETNFEIIDITNPIDGDYSIRSSGQVAPIPVAAHVDATLSATALPGAPLSQLSPKLFNTYFPPSDVPNARHAGEPSIGVDWKSGAAFFEAGANQIKVTFDDSSLPAKATWTDVTNGVNQGKFTGDPILFTDRYTGRTIADQLTLACSLMAYTDDDGASWTPTEGCGVPFGVDHETVGGGPYSSQGTVPPLPLSTLAGYPDAVYYCSQNQVTAHCARSDDGGLTFGVASEPYTTQCQGLHGHVKVAPDGTVYLPNGECENKPAVAVSTDNGFSWSVEEIPGGVSGRSDPSVGIGANNTVYFGWDDADGTPKIAVSHDHGQTWSAPVDVGASFGIHNTEFPAVVAGDDDRAAYAFLGSTTSGNDQQADYGCNYDFTDCLGGIWRLYVAYTYDGGKTWTTTDATPDQPVQRGCVWNAGGGNPCRNLLDFMDATIDAHGRVLVGYTEGCTGKCVSSTNPKDNPYDDLSAISRQQCGRGLLAAYDGKFGCDSLSNAAVAPANEILYGSPSAGRVHAAGRAGMPNTSGDIPNPLPLLPLLLLPALAAVTRRYSR